MHLSLKSLVMQAYEREEEEEIPLQDSLKGIFGPAENLIGKQFIIGADLIKKHPKITTAFIKLGTFGMRSGKGDSGTRPKVAPHRNGLNFCEVSLWMKTYTDKLKDVPSWLQTMRDGKHEISQRDSIQLGSKLNDYIKRVNENRMHFLRKNLTLIQKLPSLKEKYLP